MMIYRYQGLRLCSELPLAALYPEVPDAQGIVDLSLRSGDPMPQPAFLATREGWLVAPDAFGFNLPDIGYFVVRQGREIFFRAAKGATSTLVEQVLLGTGFAVAMMQRRRFCLHGAVLTKAGRTIAFCGDSGEGKSTLAMALSRAGWRVLTDDLALVQLRDGVCYIENNGRHVRLWSESLTALGYGVEGLTRISATEDKYYIRAPLEADQEGAPLDAICFLVSGPADSPFVVETVQAMPALALLRRHTYRQELLSHLGCDGSHLEHCCALLAAVPLMRFRRPRSLSRLDEMVDFVATQPMMGGSCVS